MNEEPVRIVVEGFEWDYSELGNVSHLARHDIAREDVEAVLRWGPIFIRSSETGSATHIMVGRDLKDRSLLVFLRASTTLNIWRPVTGWQSSAAHEILEKEGLI